MAPSTTKTKKVEKEEDSGIMKPISYAEADLSCKDETDDAFSAALLHSGNHLSGLLPDSSLCRRALRVRTRRLDAFTRR